MTAHAANHYRPTARTEPTRLPTRVSYERQQVHAVLDEALICHVAFIVDHAPVVLPHLFARRGETLYLHGSTGARALRPGTADGRDVCVTVTLVDGLVFARSAFHHSINYRSVVAHGRARLVQSDADKRLALDALVNAVSRARAAQTRAPTAKELAATSVLALELDEVSYKSRSGPPVDDEEDLALEHWAGVLPLTVVAGRPVPAAGVKVPVPADIATLTMVAASGGLTAPH